jgi:hypothetical protein
MNQIGRPVHILCGVLQSQFCILQRNPKHDQTFFPHKISPTMTTATPNEVLLLIITFVAPLPLGLGVAALPGVLVAVSVASAFDPVVAVDFDEECLEEGNAVASAGLGVIGLAC